MRRITMSDKKIWCEEAAMNHPKQWIVMVNMEYDYETNKSMGIVHHLAPTDDEAYAVCRALGNSMGDTLVLEGFDDTLRFGGFSLWDI